MLESLKKIFNDLFITEGSKTKDENKKYEYGCVMLGFDIPKEVWNKVQDLIEDDDVVTDNGLGREMDPHVTLLYGIHADVPDEDVEKIIDELWAPDLKFHKLSIFENPDFDVVKFSIKHDDLNEMNKMLKELPFTNSFPNYEAHATVAYVKSGTGKKYVQTLKDELNFDLKPNKILYSKPNGGKKDKKTYKFKDGEN